MGIREYGYIVGEGRPGASNRITDVPGVKVGHCTIDTERNQTGVTVILPCEGTIFQKKPVAAVYTLNGFGKTMGTIQIDELGVLETPIALTNTLNVGKAADALVEYTKQECEKAGIRMVSVNPLVGETNDSRINHILNRAVETEHVLEAIRRADREFAQGAVGAGRSTVCFGLKGGIGSASRLLRFGQKEYTVGALVQSNFGSMKDLMICGSPVGRRICEKMQAQKEPDKGSIMIVLGTDIPLSSRQLKRVLKRAAVGLIRTGSYMGHGSGDVFIGFTNGCCMPDEERESLQTIQCFPENQLDKVFRLAAESVEEAVLNSLVYADAARGLDGRVFHSLREFLQKPAAKVLKTERLILRPWRETDAESLYEYAKDPDVGPSAGWPPHKSLEESRDVIKNALCGRECYAVCLKDSDTAIGSIELILNGSTDMTQRDDECELGYWIGKSFWGQGMIPEAARELIRHGFEDLHMQVIWCGYYDGNTKSKRVQEKVGFVYHHTCEAVPVPLLGETRVGHTNYMTKERWLSLRCSSGKNCPESLDK